MGHDGTLCTRAKHPDPAKRRAAHYIGGMSEPARDLPGNRPVAEPPAGGFAKRPGPVAGTGLDPECTFETFVIDDGNRFAHAAAYAVAEAPAQAYSPLFIYGAPGVGKTHLLHAIGHRIQALHTGLKVRYIGSREFSRDFISTTRDGHQDAFRRQYRDMDVLLVDDIQFLADEEGTQQEFSRTFSSLHNAGRQLVIGADRAPKRLVMLDDRLRGQFEWGLLTDIQPPHSGSDTPVATRPGSHAPGRHVADRLSPP
jgi:chromosomal replication initiator protein